MWMFKNVMFDAPMEADFAMAAGDEVAVQRMRMPMP